VMTAWLPEEHPVEQPLCPALRVQQCRAEGEGATMQVCGRFQPVSRRQGSRPGWSASTAPQGRQGPLHEGGDQE
jgi:hypothetical protein